MGVRGEAAMSSGAEVPPQLRRSNSAQGRSLWRDVTDTPYDDPTPPERIFLSGMWKYVVVPFIQGVCLGIGQYGAKMYFDEWSAKRSQQRALETATAVKGVRSESGPKEA